eukprot:TRINITY_DN46326_c0_g1_i1.p1 TRINITY_DN46326_c0_g1~~TRINITY_DN46326_c0_g1_i1.p1  ORF type:complete len:359 (+),score=42.30 TRINITY_DN46326_c0_g1_i1:110-1186(+)
MTEEIIEIRLEKVESAWGLVKDGTLRIDRSRGVATITTHVDASVVYGFRLERVHCVDIAYVEPLKTSKIAFECHLDACPNLPRSTLSFARRHAGVVPRRSVLLKCFFGDIMSAATCVSFCTSHSHLQRVTGKGTVPAPLHTPFWLPLYGSYQRIAMNALWRIYQAIVVPATVLWFVKGLIRILSVLPFSSVLVDALPDAVELSQTVLMYMWSAVKWYISTAFSSVLAFVVSVVCLPFAFPLLSALWSFGLICALIALAGQFITATHLPLLLCNLASTYEALLKVLRIPFDLRKDVQAVMKVKKEGSKAAAKAAKIHDAIRTPHKKPGGVSVAADASTLRARRPVPESENGTGQTGGVS